MLFDCAQNITSDTILFRDALTTHLQCPNGLLRQSLPADRESIFEHTHGPVGDWLIEIDGRIVATGGAYYHYNPPYSDSFMEVAPPHRRHGYGNYL